MKKLLLSLSIFISVFFISSDHFAFADYQPDQVVYFDLVTVSSSEWHFILNPSGDYVAVYLDTAQPSIKLSVKYFNVPQIIFDPDLARLDFISCNRKIEYVNNGGWPVNCLLFTRKTQINDSSIKNLILLQSDFGFDPYNPPPLTTPTPIIPAGTTEEYLDFGFNFIFSFVTKTLHVLFLYDLGRILVYTLILSVVGGLLYFFIKPGGR